MRGTFSRSLGDGRKPRRFIAPGSKLVLESATGMRRVSSRPPCKSSKPAPVPVNEWKSNPFSIERKSNGQEDPFRGGCCRPRSLDRRLRRLAEERYHDAGEPAGGDLAG